MAVSETKLLPCPFCGGEPELVTGGPGNWYVRCLACKAATDDTMRDRASKLWNTRSLTAALSDQVASNIEQFISDMADSVNEVKATERQKEIYKASLRMAITHAKRKAAHRVPASPEPTEGQETVLQR